MQTTSDQQFKERFTAFAQMAEAKQQQRNRELSHHRSTPRPLSGKDRVLREWRPVVGEQVVGLAKSVRDILKEMSK